MRAAMERSFPADSSVYAPRFTVDAMFIVFFTSVERKLKPSTVNLICPNTFAVVSVLVFTRISLPGALTAA